MSQAPPKSFCLSDALIRSGHSGLIASLLAHDAKNREEVFMPHKTGGTYTKAQLATIKREKKAKKKPY